MPKIRTVSFSIEALPPFRLDYTVWCLRRRPENRMDAWDGTTYQRMLVVDGIPHLVTAEQARPEDPAVDVTVKALEISERTEDSIGRICRDLFGLDRDISGFYRLSRKNEILDRVVRRFSGVKPPKFPSVFEGLLNGIVCQKISLSACIQILGRLAETYGVSDERLSALHAFPGPSDFPLADPHVLRPVGLSRQKSATVITIAGREQEGDLDLEDIGTMSDGEAERVLRQIKGVGPWTARYVLLRGLGRLNVFPSGDVGAENRLRELFPGDDDTTRSILDSIAPYAGLLYFHLLLAGLADRGILQESRASRDP